MGLMALIRGLLGRPASPAGDEGTAVGTTVAVADPGPASTPTWVPDRPPWWVPRGEPLLTPPAAGGDDQLPTPELLARFEEAAADPDRELPQLPQVAQQLLVLLRGEDADLRQAADIAARDPALAADVLRLVNSVAYRGVDEIRRLDLALARLGRRAARALVLTSSMKAVAIRTGGARYSLGEELWQCSVASGVVAGSLSGRHGLPEDDAFLVGLLHDIGMLAVLKIVHGHQVTNGEKVPRPVFDALCQQWHETLGRRMATAWNLPDPLPEVIGDHHRDPFEADRCRDYRLLVRLADVVCAMLEYAPYVPYDFFNLPCVRRLGLEDAEDARALLEEWPMLIAEHLEPVSPD